MVQNQKSRMGRKYKYNIRKRTKMNTAKQSQKEYNGSESKIKIWEEIQRNILKY